MTTGKRPSSEMNEPLTAYRWIKGLAMMAGGKSALVADASPPHYPTIYETTITDQEVLLSGGTLTPVPGFRLKLHAGGPNGQDVTLGDTLLGVDDYQFIYTDDLLFLELSVGAQTCSAHKGLYERARIRFTPSGQTFTGLISQICPMRSVTYTWEGSVVLRA